MILRSPEETMVFAPDQESGGSSPKDKKGDKDNIEDKRLAKMLKAETQDEDDNNPLPVRRIRNEAMKILQTTRTGRARRQLISEEIAEGNFERVHLLKVITPEIAKQLVGSGLHSLQLYQLRTLSPECAEILAGYKGLLSLDGLRELIPETAQALAKGTFGQLALDGITQLDVETACILSRSFFKALSLSGLADVSDELANALGNFQGVLYLDGIKSIKLETLRLLLKTNTFNAGELKKINPKIAEALSQLDDGDRIDFDQLEKAAPKFVSNARAYLRLLEYENRNRRISIKELSELFPKDENPELNELFVRIYDNGKNKKVIVTELRVKAPDLSDQIDKFAQLGRPSNVISLQGLGEADDTCIQVINAHKERLFVSQKVERLCALDSTTMRIVKNTLPDHERNLGIWKQILLGNIRLIGLLTYVDERIAEDLLKAFEGEHVLPLASVKSLSPATAKKLATFKGSEIYLEKVDDISFEAAEELAKFPGRVVLANGVDLKENIGIWREIMGGYFERTDEVVGLIPEVARKIVSSGLDDLQLDSLLDLNSEIASILSQFKGKKMSLNRIHNIEIRGLFEKEEREKNIKKSVAFKLASMKVRILDLSGIEDMDEQTAEIFFSNLQAKVIVLDGIKSLKSQFAEIFYEDYVGGVSLRGITEIEPGAKKYMRKMLREGTIILTEEIKEEFKKIS